MNLNEFKGLFPHFHCILFSRTEGIDILFFLKSCTILQGSIRFHFRELSRITEISYEY